MGYVVVDDCYKNGCSSPLFLFMLTIFFSLFVWLAATFTMQEHIGIPACFSSGDKQSDDPAVVTRLSHRVVSSVYRTKVADQCRLITITWSKNLLFNGLSVSVEGPEGEAQFNCKIEMKPWKFWRKQGSKRFVVDCKAVDVFWDLRTAKFDGEVEPISEFYVAVVSDEEVILLLGDRKKDGYRRTGCRPALIDPTLVLKKEHVFGKKKFSTSSKFLENGENHDISVIIKHSPNGKPEMEIRIDGQLAIHVKHLQWKFRGNERVDVHKLRLEIYWDVHDWLFSPVPRPALFIFKPSLCPSQSSSIGTASSESTVGLNSSGSSEFTLFVYAWKDEREEYIHPEIPSPSP